MYPVAPGTGEYAIGSPLFSNVKLHLENGNTFEIKANNNTSENVYIDSIMKNNKSYDLNYFIYDDIMNGEVFSMEMTETPNLERGKSKKSRPFSLNN
jgi:putative alpha-1,2-mannosidase